jgi:hypothetical protein
VVVGALWSLLVARRRQKREFLSWNNFERIILVFGHNFRFFLVKNQVLISL